MQSLLQDCLTHSCLDFVLEPLKGAAIKGVVMSDPKRYQQQCHTFLASYIVDTPEAQMLAGVGGSMSPNTTAFYKHFGDNFKHPPPNMVIYIK